MLSVYHVTLRVTNPTDDPPRRRIQFVVGVCAATKTEAVRLVYDRMTSDGYLNPRSERCERVASQGEWMPGNTLVYSEAAA